MRKKVAIVTGSSSGIGAATALAFAAKGCNVVINYVRSEGPAREVVAAVEALGAEAICIQGDVAEDTVCRALAQGAMDRWGRIDFLINNAGTTKFVDQTDLEGLDAVDFQRIYGVNVIGAYQMIRACVPAMKAGGNSAIVNVSSTAALTGLSSSTAYAASKGALISLTKSIARVMGPEIRCNAICPGFIDNRWNQSQLDEKAYSAVKNVMGSATPLRRVPVSDDVAETILWLCEGARCTTGEVIQIDSGAHLGSTGRTIGTSQQ